MSMHRNKPKEKHEDANKQTQFLLLLLASIQFHHFQKSHSRYSLKPVKAYIIMFFKAFMDLNGNLCLLHVKFVNFSGQSPYHTSLLLIDTFDFSI